MINKKISFIPSSEDVENYISCPKPSKNYLPLWYKNSESIPKKFIHDNKNGEIKNKVVKMCMPFLDSLSNGYIQESWCDIKIEKVENKINFYYSSDPQIMDARENSSIPLLKNFYNIEFIWKMPWEIKTDPGYSILITHPLNRIDLPFYTLSGIIDSDFYFHGKFGNIPFYINKDFEGIIPCGTPLYQIIPIKRNSFIHIPLKYNKKKSNKNYYIATKKFWGTYKNNFWQKKQFS
jgi:hypothetical protein